MNKDIRNQGFIVKIIVIVVGACLAFIVLSVLAGKSGLSTLGPSSSFTDFISKNSSGSIDARVNPMLDFGDNGGLGGSDDVARTIPNSDGKGTSAYSGRVSLSTGNTYSIQPSEEYLVLRNGSSGPINITGWSLSNGKGSRPIQNSSNSYVYPTADTAVIGQGTEFLDPSGNFATGPIVLNSGDTAYVLTGGPFSQFPFSISTSFRENICEGYLENYPFTPQINRSCPSLTNDPGVRQLTDECYDYVASLGSCPNPERTDRKTYDKQPSHCKAFLTARIGYPACVAQNMNRSDFKLKQWRVFLGQRKEMWAAQRETITLYDATGKIVDQITY